MNETMESLAREGKERIDPLPDARDVFRNGRARLRAIDARTRALIHERPLTAIAAAVALGFVLRRLLPFGR